MNIQVSKDGKIVTVDDIIYIRKDEVSAPAPEKDKAPLTERISACKNIGEKFAICCKEVGESPDDDKFYKGDRDTQAFERLKVVSLALNGGKKLTKEDNRYYPYFYYDKNADFVCGDSWGNGDDGYFSVSPAISVADSELAAFSGNEFLEYWKMWHGQD